jgi:hypothetical protein
MTRSNRHFGLTCIALAFLGSMTSMAGASIYINPLKPGGELSNIGFFKPPGLHTNQGGRSHGGNTAIVISSRPDSGLDNLTNGSLIENALALTFDTVSVKALPEGGITMSGQWDSMPMSSSLFAENGSMNNGNMVPGPGPLVLLLTAGLGMQRRRRRS